MIAVAAARRDAVGRRRGDAERRDGVHRRHAPGAIEQTRAPVHAEDAVADAHDGVHAAQERIAFGLVRTFRDRTIEFAYPTQTTFTAAPDGTMVMPYPQVMPVRASGPPAD